MANRLIVLVCACTLLFVEGCGKKSTPSPAKPAPAAPAPVAAAPAGSGVCAKVRGVWVSDEEQLRIPLGGDQTGYKVALEVGSDAIRLWNIVKRKEEVAGKEPTWVSHIEGPRIDDKYVQWVGWHVTQLSEQDNICVFTAIRAVSGELFPGDNIYGTVTQIGLKLDGGRVSLQWTPKAPDTLKCDKCKNDGHYPKVCGEGAPCLDEIRQATEALSAAAFEAATPRLTEEVAKARSSMLTASAEAPVVNTRPAHGDEDEPAATDSEETEKERKPTGKCTFMQQQTCGACATDDDCETSLVKGCGCLESRCRFGRCTACPAEKICDDDPLYDDLIKEQQEAASPAGKCKKRCEDTYERCSDRAMKSDTDDAMDKCDSAHDRCLESCPGS